MNQAGSLPVVSASDYRQAVDGERWERSPAVVTGPGTSAGKVGDESSESVERAAADSLLTPLDFPPIGDAILPGDHVALAVDPNVPQVASILKGILKQLQACQTGRVSIVLWPESPDQLVEVLRSEFANESSLTAWAAADGSSAPTEEDLPANDSLSQTVFEPSVNFEFPIHVWRHEPRSRHAVRYCAADDNAEAIYLARDLVDADFTLPILAARAQDAGDSIDSSGVFPVFADSATMKRAQSTSIEESKQIEFQKSWVSGGMEIGWLLGVQLTMLVSSNAAGNVNCVLAGAPGAIRHELKHLHAAGELDHESETLPHADLIIAPLDGNAHAQTWANVARAAIAASRHTEVGGTIVIWSRLRTSASQSWRQCLMRLEEASQETDEPNTESEADQSAQGEFENWDFEIPFGEQLAQACQDYRVLLHSELPSEEVESLGLGVLDSSEQLNRLSESFQNVGVVRASQFQSASIAKMLISEEESM